MIKLEDGTSVSVFQCWKSNQQRLSRFAQFSVLWLLFQNHFFGATTECRATFKHSPNEPARLARQWMKERGIIVCTLSVGFIN